MTGRQFRVDWRPDDTPEALRAAYRAEQDIMLRTRLHALWLLRCGRRMGEAAVVLDIHYRTLQRVGVRYRTGGVKEVLSHTNKAREAIQVLLNTSKGRSIYGNQAKRGSE